MLKTAVSPSDHGDGPSAWVNAQTGQLKGYFKSVLRCADLERAASTAKPFISVAFRQTLQKTPGMACLRGYPVCPRGSGCCQLYTEPFPPGHIVGIDRRGNTVIRGLPACRPGERLRI